MSASRPPAGQLAVRPVASPLTHAVLAWNCPRCGSETFAGAEEGATVEEIRFDPRCVYCRLRAYGRQTTAAQLRQKHDTRWRRHHTKPKEDSRWSRS